MAKYSCPGPTRPRGRPVVVERRFVDEAGIWYRTCKDCGRQLPETPENFYMHSGSDSFMSRCKTCFSAYVRANRRAHRNKNVTSGSLIELFMQRLESYYGDYKPTSLSSRHKPEDQFVFVESIEQFLYRHGSKIMCDLTGMELSLERKTDRNVFNQKNPKDKIDHDYPWLIRIDPTLPWLRSNTLVVAYWVFTLIEAFGGGEGMYQAIRKIGFSYKEDTMLFQSVVWPREYFPWKDLVNSFKFGPTTE